MERKIWFQKPAGEVGKGFLTGTPASGALGAQLAEQFKLSSQAGTYNLLGKKTDIVGDGVTPFRESLREVRAVNMPFQIGQRSSEAVINTNQASLLKIATQGTSLAEISGK